MTDFRIGFLFVVFNSVLCAPQYESSYENSRRFRYGDGYGNGPGHLFGWHGRRPVNYGRDHREGPSCQDFLPSNHEEGKISEENQRGQGLQIVDNNKGSARPILNIGLIPEKPGIPPPVQTNTNRKDCPDATYRYHKESGTCQKLGEQGKCGEQMTFYADGRDFGSCDCKESITNYRPTVYWGPTDRCYTLYEQGPCQSGKWLILVGTKPPMCVKRQCPPNLEDSPDKYWFIHQGRCLKTDTVNEDSKEFCGNSTNKIYHSENYIEGFGFVTCSEVQVVPRTRFLTGAVQDLPCKPGQKKSLNGECNRVAKFL